MSSEQLYIGIDISKAHLDVFTHETGTFTRYRNTSGGIGELLAALDDAVALIVVEPTAGHEKPVMRVLQQAGLPVACVHAARLRAYAHSLGFLAKTDKLDARVLADYAARVQPVPNPVSTDAQQRLCSLVKRQRQLTRQIIQEKGALEHMEAPDLVADIRDNIAALQARCEEITRMIRAHIASDIAMARRYAILRSCKGIGPVTAAVLMADMPELGTIDNSKAKALGGLAPMNRDSGQRQGRRYITGGRPSVRQCMYQAILSASQYNPDIKAYYERKIAEGKAPKDAMMACAAKLLCTLNALLRDDRKWQP